MTREVAPDWRVVGETSAEVQHSEGYPEYASQTDKELCDGCLAKPVLTDAQKQVLQRMLAKEEDDPGPPPGLGTSSGSGAEWFNIGSDLGTEDSYWVGTPRFGEAEPTLRSTTSEWDTPLSKPRWGKKGHMNWIREDQECDSPDAPPTGIDAMGSFAVTSEVSLCPICWEETRRCPRPATQLSNASGRGGVCVSLRTRPQGWSAIRMFKSCAKCQNFTWRWSFGGTRTESWPGLAGSLGPKVGTSCLIPSRGSIPPFGIWKTHPKLVSEWVRRCWASTSMVPI